MQLVLSNVCQHDKALDGVGPPQQFKARAMKPVVTRETSLSTPGNKPRGRRIGLHSCPRIKK
jgi:hypothetical protein